ncbi:MAG: hypothetical protein ICV66_10255 [Chitinophagaceae bacterium]|nr:hypothetical protein [Chitinophagaceae bacterium]
MRQRVDIKVAKPRIYEVMMRAEKLVSSFSLAPTLCEFIRIMVSQINGCGYYLVVHTKMQ